MRNNGTKKEERERLLTSDVDQKKEEQQQKRKLRLESLYCWSRVVKKVSAKPTQLLP